VYFVVLFDLVVLLFSKFRGFLQL